jgi:spore germination cell wall hydrolase CwlJ-like protein
MENANWYKKAQQDELLKEAGAKENMAILMIGTLSAVATFFEGNMLLDYLNKKNVPMEQQQALVQTVNQINNTDKSIQELDKNDFVQANQIVAEEKDEKAEDLKEMAPNVEFSNEEYKTRESMPAEEVIARTIYDEARGEGYDGMKMVAKVILNRSAGTPESMKAICLKAWQFSGWNKGNILPRGEDTQWEQAKQLTKFILDPSTEPNEGGYYYFANPEVVLKQKGVSVKIDTFEDVKNLSEDNLKKLPAFMFNRVKQDLGGGAWKWIYPKTKNNLKPAKVDGNHFFYSV